MPIHKIQHLFQFYHQRILKLEKVNERKNNAHSNHIRDDHFSYHNNAMKFCDDLLK